MAPSELLQRTLDDISRVTGKKHKTRGREHDCCCPAHDDGKASLGVKLGSEGIAMKCQAGCTFDAICAAINRKQSELFFSSNGNGDTRPRRAVPVKAVGTLEEALKGGTPSHIHIYQNANGFDVAAAVRYDEAGGGKRFSQFTKTEAGWINKGPEGSKPLYRLPELLKSQSHFVFVTEGEKCVEVIRALGLTATTSIGGAGNAKGSDWTPLAGRNVVILPDNDKAGAKYQNDVLTHLAALRPMPSVRIVTLPGLGDGDDVADYAEDCRRNGWADGEIAAALIQHATNAEIKAMRAPEDFKPRPMFLDEIMPEPGVAWIWDNYIARGAISLLNGFWKAGKTTMLALLIKAMENGGEMVTPVAQGKILVVSEESAKVWTERDRKIGLGRWVQVEFARWMKKPDAVQWGGYVDALYEICEKQQIDLLIIDPFMRISPVKDENSPVDVGAALAPLSIFKDSRTGVLLIHHSKKGNDISLEQMARGSGELQAFVEIIINFQRKSRDLKDRNRTISLMSRFDTPQEEVQIELSADGLTYVPCGTSQEAEERSARDILWNVLQSPPNEMTIRHIQNNWEGEPPSRGTLSKILAAMCKSGHVGMMSGGGKSHEKLYWRRHGE